MATPRSVHERLVRFVQELERLEEEKQAAAEAMADCLKRAKVSGFDPATLKAVLKLRKMTPGERKAKRALELIYMASLGMLDGEPLTDEARRWLDDQAQEPGPAPSHGAARAQRRESGGEAPAPGRASREQPSAPPQLPMALKDPEEARQEGRAAAAAGKRIYDNPFPAGDPCRAAWDEGWCEAKESNGMETPAAYARRTKKDDQDQADQSKPSGKGGA